jgi:hypothetical protein
VFESLPPFSSFPDAKTPINSFVGAIVQGIRARGPEISPRESDHDN